MVTRRNFVLGTAAATVSSSVAGVTSGQTPVREQGAIVRPPASGPGSYTPVHTLNGVTLPLRMVDGVKVGHLIAERVEHEMAPGMTLRCWGYNGRTTGPTIEAVEGDRLRIYVTNRLPEPTSVHWHGLILPNGMDGVSGLTQRPIPPGETFCYEFPLVHAGTFMYHPHYDEMTQMAMGMMGMFIVHPRRPTGPRVDRDYVMLLNEWSIRPGTATPDPMEMNDFNMLSINSKAFPGTEAIVCALGERVRLRIGNLSAMNHHPIHMHGHYFKITATNGGPIPRASQWPETTVLVNTGTTRDIEFLAEYPGDWPIHCHMTHHGMNQMGHGLANVIGADLSGVEERVRSVGVPGYMNMGQNGMGGMGEHAEHMDIPRNSLPMIGAHGPYGYIEMGGMFTLVKVRERITGFEDPGWYEHPAGTVAEAATEEQLNRDGIDVGTD